MSLKPNTKSLNEKISFTADGVAYRRAMYTDIPYSREIFEILQELQGPFDPKEKDRAEMTRNVTPIFESRYILTDQLLKGSGVRHILELASGLSPRGFIWSQYPNIRYVELDLLKKIALKRRVLSRLREHTNIQSKSNLILEGGSVSDDQSFELAWNDLEGSFDPMPAGVICEGLLRYMNWQDKEKLAKNIAHGLEYSGGGVWITPDIELLSDINATTETKARYDMMAKEWGFDVRPNLFRDMEHAIEFFRQFGFKVVKHCHMDILDQLVSPKRLELSNEIVHAELAKRFTFVMSL